ncbi:hypothetical protein GGR53DRAFT_34109 [Hypoxylon sp. FL1150]|nr:hypothetical protein GGR53DRAFT_34109 [Hypoxylon sp. FL1150]
MAFLDDPRLRQRWNQISHTTETVTENAAAGIWSFGHTYINPCLSSVYSTFDSCTAVCLGDREERARRARERQRARGNAEYSFDFYDDWDEELGGDGDDGRGIIGGWRSEDWDRLLAGTGRRRGAGEVEEQPRRKRGMSYGTRGSRRRASTHQEDPTLIPSTAPLGFLSRWPFKIGGTLRYKPSAANLQEHPGASRTGLDAERVPLLGEEGDTTYLDEASALVRKRSATVGSGDTSDSYRSRGDLFPSDEEGEEDAVPLDDEFAITLDHVDDRASNKTRSSKGKRIADPRIPRSVSITTMDSTRPSLQRNFGSGSLPPESPALISTPSLDDLRLEEERLEREENELVEKKRMAAADLALRRGLSRENLQVGFIPKAKSEIVKVEKVPVATVAVLDEVTDDEEADSGSGSAGEARHPPLAIPSSETRAAETPQDDFVPARLPFFR